MDPSLYNLRASKCQKTLEEVCLKYNIASTQNVVNFLLRDEDNIDNIRNLLKKGG